MVCPTLDYVPNYVLSPPCAIGVERRRRDSKRRKSIARRPGSCFKPGSSPKDFLRLKSSACGDSPAPIMPRARGPLDDLRLAHKILTRLKISHALIGGWAVVAWGVARTTMDLDMLVLVDREAKARLGRAFKNKVPAINEMKEMPRLVNHVNSWHRVFAIMARWLSLSFPLSSRPTTARTCFRAPWPPSGTRPSPTTRS